MALNKYFRISALCLVAALAFSACAKKNNDLAARRNAAGAAATDAPATAQADAQAAAMGYDTEFMKISNPTQVANGALSIVSRIRVGNSFYDINTSHTTYGEGSQPAVASKVLGNASFQVSAVCGTENCNPYYIVINITANGAPVKQMAMMKFFYGEGAGTEGDIYYSRNQFMTFPQAIQELKGGVRVGE